MDLDSGMLLNLSRRIIIAKKDWFDRGVMLNMSRQQGKLRKANRVEH